MAIDLEWLHKLCDPDRPIAAEPHIVSHAGHDYVLATNLLAAVWVDAAGATVSLKRAENDGIQDTTTEVFDTVDGRIVDLNAFKQWLGEPGWQITKPCGCGGKPKRCDNCCGTGVCNCMSCEADHDCGVCDGTGYIECGKCEGGVITEVPLRPGRILGHHYNRELIAQYLRGCDGDTATIALARHGMLLICGQYWRAAIMPLHYTYEEPDCPRWDGEAA